MGIDALNGGNVELAALSFEIGAIRPPSEGGSCSLLIRVTRNCPWNRCTFCYGRPYDHEKFQMRSVEEVKADIDTAALISDEIKKVSWEIGCAGDIAVPVGTALLRRMPQLGNSHSFINVFNWLISGGKTAFLQDADSPVLPTPQLVEIIRHLREKFPTLERVTSYARAKTIVKKKEAELKDLCQVGLSRLHLGLETGDDELLGKVKKGVTGEEHIIAGRKLKEAGIELSEYIMPGLGGKAMSRQHAENTARVLNAINPDFIRSRPFTPLPGTPLFDDYTNNNLELLSPHESIEEMKILIAGLDVTSRLCFDHFRNPAYTGATGELTHLLRQDYDGYKLPEEKEFLLALIEKGLKISEERFLQAEDYIHMGSL
ncbi:MAG: radical SAM protein [Syntrophales bacterium]|nr:radical SAM protein [Syntrophales bacterium]